ncbi:MAG TPA: hypothetical protein VK754_14085, partial [Propionibacteriaceae bacterium]|nr:hypothetical protein [Propionibacteriaceae bacterium]
MQEPSLAAKLGAEFLGTFLLVFMGCGAAILAATFLGDDDLDDEPRQQPITAGRSIAVPIGGEAAFHGIEP